MFTGFAVGFTGCALFQALLHRDERVKSFLWGQVVAGLILIGFYQYEVYREKHEKEALLTEANKVVVTQQAEVEK